MPNRSTLAASTLMSEVNNPREAMCLHMKRLVLDRAVLLSHHENNRTLDIHFFKGSKLHKLSFRGKQTTINRLVELFNERTRASVV